MKINTDKVKKHKLGFFFLWLGVLCGIILMTNIKDIVTDTTEVTAVVTKTFNGSGKAGSAGPKMNIEWQDEDGDIHTDGSLSNTEGYEVGDLVTIEVDKETRSRRVISGNGSVVLFVLGLVTTITCLILLKIVFCIPKRYKE